MNEITIIRWCVGFLGVAIIIGLFASYFWYMLMCWLMGISCKIPFLPKPPLKETGQLTGVIERAFFTVAVALELGGTAIAMIAWVLLKNSMLWPGFTKEGSSAQGTVSLMSSIGSLLIAILAATVCQGKWF